MELEFVFVPRNIWNELANVKFKPIYANDVPSMSHKAGGKKIKGLKFWFPWTKPFRLNWPEVAAAGKTVRRFVMKNITWNVKKHNDSPKNMHTAYFMF